ncbi:hypothetical protein DACRYDRAFT_119786 [Dacryopinax primogenitus]|uniref:Bromo domain-containing protein n=1 Tax=Dacryopinax primogenitus (strain DJM 731) TaxID=1858805 RepID=M5FN82_DACPD|nr:uncharacterized protein DACRYDRAFT_119786 [Dacryopinax primogenitus]EJT96990.1 hypothetical protein DACRYDRAFT_119786 [Dacryopinax primogenitus]
MKNLLSAIASGSLGNGVKAAHVKEILAEVQSYRDNKAADAFYETLDRVLSELRATPEAVAFRNPVKRSEAPDYEDYIKNPMDLSTMVKKVKNRVYENKAQFATDLNLIWDNCLTYNSEPTHPLRRQAQLMRRKADHVLERINDRGEVAKPTKNGKLKPKMSAKDRERERQLERERSKMREREKKMEQTAKTTPSTGGLGQSLSVLLAMDAKEAAQGEANAEQEAAAKAELENAKKDENVLVSLPQRTPDAMTRFLEMTRKLDSFDDRPLAQAGPSYAGVVDGIIPKSEYPVFTPFGPMDVFPAPTFNSDPQRTPERPRKRTLAEAFDAAEVEAKAVVEKKREERILQNGHAPKRKNLGVRDELLKDWYGDFMKPEMMASGVPELGDWIADDAVEMPPKKKPKANGVIERKKKKHVRKETLRSSIESNVQTLYEVRKMKDKLQRIADIREAEEKGEEDIVMEDPLPPPPEQPDDPPRPGYAFEPEDGIKNTSYMLLRHAGFEGCSKTALGVVNDVAAEYIRNIGRSMRYFLDMHSADMPAEEIVLHTLFENGVTEVNQLERYVRDDVQRYGGRLQEISRRLQTAYREQTEKEVDEEDFDEEEDIVGGALGDMLGVDFLGLQDLGLEGITSLSVPKRLLLGKGKKAAAAAAKEQPAEKPLPYPKPAPFIPFTEDKIDKQIGLLHNFYKSKLLPMPAPSENGPENHTKAQHAQNSKNAHNAAAISPLDGVFPRPVAEEPKASTEIKRYVPEDPGNASKTKIGTKGEILMHASASSSKKKKGKSATGSEAPAPAPPPVPPVVPKMEEKRPSPAPPPVKVLSSVPASESGSVAISPAAEKRKTASQSPVNGPRAPPVAPSQPPPGMMPHPAYPQLPPFPGYPPPLAPGAPPMWPPPMYPPPWMQPIPNGTVPAPPLAPDGTAVPPPKQPAFSPTRGGAGRGRGSASSAGRGGAARGGVTKPRGAAPRGTPAKS